MKIKNILILVVLAVVLTATGLVVRDVLFSKPLIMKGIVVEKIYVPEKNVAGPHALPYGKYRSYNYTVQAEKEEQWIAFVKIDDGQILKVNCHSHHYQQKQVGDTLHFKEYKGDVFHIDYFAHNEEDVQKENELMDGVKK